jgi:hypothetical protein
VGRAFTMWLLTGANVTRGTSPSFDPGFAEGELHLVVVAVQGARRENIETSCPGAYAFHRTKLKRCLPTLNMFIALHCNGDKAPKDVPFDVHACLAPVLDTV